MLPDLLAPGLRVLFCGTAAGTASAARGHYYAGPGNRFWGLLAQTGLTPRRLRPDEDHLLPGFGLGLTDLAKGVAGMDREIPRGAYDPARLAALVAEWQPGVLAFTSLMAARLALGDATLGAGPLPQRAGLAGAALWALPSPSGSNGHFSPQVWQALADHVRLGP